MQNLVFAPITKVKENDDGTCEVYGTAAAEVVDKTREILDYALSKPQFEKWRDETLDRSQGKSLGNIRSMHGKIAAGKVTAMDFDDAGKTVNISTHIIDPVEAKKCALGVYTGFSVGGSYARRWPDPTQKGVMRYSPELSEISIVDNPCVHSATFQHIKLDGATELCKFAAVSTGFSRRKGRLEKPEVFPSPERRLTAHPVKGPVLVEEKSFSTRNLEKTVDQPRSPVSRFAAGTTDKGAPHFGNILRGKAIKAKADDDKIGAATYSADAASYDAFAEGTPEAHDKAAAAHTAASQVHKDGNSPISALLHEARAAHHKNEAASKLAVAAQKCAKCGGDLASGKCEKCEKAVGVGVPPQPAPFTQSFTNTDPTSVTTDFRGPTDKVAKAAKCPKCGADLEGDYCATCDQNTGAEDGDDDEELERMFLPRHEGFEKLFNDLFYELEKGGPGSGPRPGGGRSPVPVHAGLHAELAGAGFVHQGSEIKGLDMPQRYAVSSYEHPDGRTAETSHDGKWHTQTSGTKGPYGPQIKGSSGGRTQGFGVRELKSHLSGKF